jgi:uncharacterized membrane protein
MTKRLIALAVVVVTCWWATGCEVPVEDLGGFRSHLSAINHQSVVAGWSAAPGSTPEVPIGHGFVRSTDGVVTDLSPLPGDDHSYPYAINEGRVAVGASARYVVPVGGGAVSLTGHRAVRWDPSGQVTDLGTLGGDRAVATDINRHGVIVGWSDTAAGGRAFVIDPDVGTMVALPNLPNTTSSSARAINDDGIVVGTATIGGFPGSNFYTGAPVMWDLTAGTVTSLVSTGLDVANDVNNAGVIAGAVEYRWADGFEHALAPALWFPDRGFVGLTPPAAGGASPSEGDDVSTSIIGATWSFYAEATAVNDRGEVIVRGSVAPSETSAAYRWTSATGLVTAGPGVDLRAVSDTGVFAGSKDDRAAIIFPDL